MNERSACASFNGFQGLPRYRPQPDAGAKRYAMLEDHGLSRYLKTPVPTRNNRVFYTEKRLAVMAQIRGPERGKNVSRDTFCPVSGPQIRKNRASLHANTRPRHIVRSGRSDAVQRPGAQPTPKKEEPSAQPLGL